MTQSAVLATDRIPAMAKFNYFVKAALVLAFAGSVLKLEAGRLVAKTMTPRHWDGES